MSSPTAATSRSRASPGGRRSRAPRSWIPSSPSSASRSRASRCSPASCCATCATPRRPSPRAKTGCAISRCTTRCAACRTGISSASGWRRRSPTSSAAARRRRVFYIDLDHFKDVNDTLGHPVGDELIRNVTLRLSHIMRGDDLVARLGGDEFAVITAASSDHAALHEIASRMIATLCAPYSVSGHTIVIGASIGIARDRPALRRLGRHHALRRHGALPREERRPQPRLHLRRGDGRRPVAAQARRAGTARDHRERRPQGVLPADLQRQRRQGCRRRGAGALAASDARHDLARPNSSRSPSTPASSSNSAPTCCGAPASTAWRGRASRFRSTSRRCNSAGSTSSAWSNASWRKPASIRSGSSSSSPRRTLLGNVESAEAAMLRLKALGVQACARRLRHRLFEPAVSAPLPVRQAQDRPQLRAQHREGAPTPPRSCMPWSASAAVSA